MAVIMSMAYRNDFATPTQQVQPPGPDLPYLTALPRQPLRPHQSPRPHRSIVHYFALAVAGTTLAGVPLGLVLGQGQLWAVTPLTSLVVFPSVAIMALLIKAVEKTRIPVPLVVMVSAATLGTVAGLILFSPYGGGWFGIAICLPIALIVAGVGLGFDKWFLSSHVTTLIATTVCGSFVTMSLILTVTLYYSA